MDFFYPPELPITSHLQAISELIENNQVTIVAGDTGSGKTTQLPKICRELFRNSPRMVGCTQPRRIAATSVCERVKEELGPGAHLVGSKIRFSDRTSGKTRIKFMTDGVLLAETRQDPLLTKYDVIIIDEAHERSLNIDFLIGYLHRLLPERADLKVVITSATIDTELFSKHFNNAPVLQIEGRTFPVKLVYAPPEDTQEELTFVEHCIEVIEKVCRQYPPGDMLVFLPTERDIRSCCEVIRGRLPDRMVLPLFGRLHAKDQHRIFQQHKQAKIVVATNVAETSVTVPGIRYVVDSGLARIASYDHRSRTTRLPVSRISQASSDQRAGRCGRIGPGICFRLYDEEDFAQRQEFTIPEIQRSNLAEVILQMIVLGLGKPADFPFLEPPKESAVRGGFKILRELQAIDKRNRLTTIGTIMAGLPIDPVISRIIIEAQKFHCLEEIIVIAAALAIQDPRVRPAEKENLADQTHKKFFHPQSDFNALLNIWAAYQDQVTSFSWGRLKRFCAENFLSFQRMREWLDLHEQLRHILKRHKAFTFSAPEPSYENLHRSLLSGLFRHVARKKKGPVYQTIGNSELMVFPGSQQYQRSGDWIIAGSFLETSRLFALTIATIEPEWIEAAAKPFCSYSWTNARWQKKSGRVIADEQVSLQGLVLFSGRIVNFGLVDKKNRPEARKIFIREALVNNQINGSFPFLDRNNGLMAKWQESEHKLRRKNIVIDEATIFAFYNDRLPENVYDRATLLRFLKANDGGVLKMSESDILLQFPEENELLNFPPTLKHGDTEIRLSYCFEPGTPEDGVTAIIPDYLVEQVKDERFEWLVPGLIVEKTTYLLKGLPKKIRKRLIPVNATVERLLDSVEYGRGNYFATLSATIFKFFKITIHQRDWPREFPEHLRMRFVIVDAHGKQLIAGRDFETLRNRQRTGPADTSSLSLRREDEVLIEQLEQRFFTRWDFSELPQRIERYGKQNHAAGCLYGAIVACPGNHAVRISYVESSETARITTVQGTRYLLQLHFKEPVKQIRKYCRVALTGPSSVWLTTLLGGTEQCCSTFLDFVLLSFFGSDFEGIISRQRYEALVASLRPQDFFPRAKQLLDEIIALLRQRREVYECIRKYENLSEKNGLNRELFEDLYDHLESIMPVDFLSTLAAEDIPTISRYLKSLSIRTERAYANPLKDRKKRLKLEVHLKHLEAFNRKELNESCLEIYQRYRFMVFELRVNVFSPEIRTAAAVSEKRLKALLQELQRSC